MMCRQASVVACPAASGSSSRMLRRTTETPDAETGQPGAMMAMSVVAGR
jgi:hypothetical protein